MKKKEEHWVKDVESLLEQSVVAEATEKVWDIFGSAMEKMDSASQELLKGFFNGVGIEQLSREHQISKSEAEAWLSRARQELVTNLRTSFRVRQ